MRTLTPLILALLMTACQAPDPDHADRARSLATEAIIVDGHIDVPYRLGVWKEDVTTATYGGDFDYPRAMAGGLDAPFMSVYIPADLQGQAQRTRALADSLIDGVESIAEAAPDRFALARSVAEIRENHANGLISLPMGMENGAPIADDPESLSHFHARGIRYITLTHGRDNGLSDSSYDTTRTWNGLSPLGKRVVSQMNDLGIMVDISHLSDAAAQQVLELSTAPVIASHSSVRAFTPGWERNMDDELIRSLADHDGIIMINFGSSFLRSEYQELGGTVQDRIEREIAEAGLSGEEANRRRADLRRAAPIGTLADVVEHINHVRDLVGPEYIGLGSDYDGVFALPAGLQDVSTYPALIQALLDEGYSEADVRGILGENLLRVWSEVERVAAATR
ncbi:MAG: membrane dipeptidase [Rhodothermales bacterium]|nr:membrane dipeptidase [Rhodothermales bacterium]